MAPQCEWPHTMMCLTPSSTTANSMAAASPDGPAVAGGTMLPALRITKTSPGPSPVIRLGTTRESAQVIRRYRGVCP